MSLRKEVTHGVVWSSVERFSKQGIQFLVTLIMARILMPADYGIIGLLAIFFSVSQAIIDSGFTNALIKKKDRSENDFYTVFLFNLFTSTSLYLLLLIFSGSIANFYEIPLLKPVIRVISLSLIIDSLTIVHRAKITIRMDFKLLMKASLIASLISGIIGILLALKGWGIWALVFQHLSNSIVNTILLFIYDKWHPKLLFSKESFKELFGFGSKLLASDVLQAFFRNINSLVIGKYYTPATLGYYTRAESFSQLPSVNFSSVLMRVTLPAMSERQDNPVQLDNMYKKFIKISSFISFPIMIGLALLATPLITVLLTEKWLEAAILLKILCFAKILYPSSSIISNYILIKGRTDILLKCEFYRQIVGILLLFAALPFGIVYVCIATLIQSIFSFTLGVFYVKIYNKMGLAEHLKLIGPSLFYSLCMGTGLILLNITIENNIVILFLGTILSIIIYWGVAHICKSEELREIYLLIRKQK